MPTRRTFLLGSIAVGGLGALGVAIGYRELKLPPRLPDSIDLLPGELSLTPYVVIDQQGIRLIAPRAEMGQGIHTTLAALVAEELDIDLSDVDVVHGPPSELFSNNVAFGPPKYPGRSHGRPTQFTGGQSSIKDAFLKMRVAGAAARDMLVRAAADVWQVEPNTLTTRNGAVIGPAGEQLDYLTLAPAAALKEVNQAPALKTKSQWTILGKSLPRIDMIGKCTGAAEFAIDIDLPNLLYATVKINPHLGGKMLGYEASKAQGMRGIKSIVPLKNGVAVVGTNTWYTFKAANAINFDWEAAEYADTTEEQYAVLRREFDNPMDYRPVNVGDVEPLLTNKPIIEGEYTAPYLAHATMEPMSATVWFNEGHLHIWAGTQNPTKTRLTGARLAGIKSDAVTVHTTYMGGGFGRRLYIDFVESAVLTAIAHEGTPVKVTWSREEDMSHDVYRPMAVARFRARVDAGQPVALDLKVSSLSLSESSAARGQKTRDPGRRYYKGKDKFLTTGLKEQPYKIPNYRVTAYQPPRQLPVGFWRGVGESQNSFFHESVMDELAHEAGRDPLEMRLALLEDPMSRKVLEAVGEMSDWGSSLPAGHGRGVAYVLSSGAATAQVMHVAMTSRGIKLINAYAAVDFGHVLDPRIITSQVEGSLIFGLTAAIKGEITVSDGLVDQQNFHQYEMLRMPDPPSIEVRLLESEEGIYGSGESGISAAAPALGNAIFRVTGQRIRALPFQNHIDFV